MWKYIGTKECNDFLLSLHLIDEKKEKEYIQLLYIISNRIKSNYNIFKIKKRSGGYRTIYEPKPLLKHIQRKILQNVLMERKTSSYAKAYCQGIPLKENAIPHVRKAKILKLDIENFFENISFLEVYHTCFPIEYYPKSVGMLLAYLCTYDDHLPQGAPTSSYISNLVMKSFDEELGNWCEKKDISYTRYSDDMTFSGDFEPSIVISKVRKMLGKLGLTLNDKKTHVISKSCCQVVTGMVVNQKVQVPLSYRKKIRQEMYYIQRYGLDSHLKRMKIQNKNEYINSLMGKIGYVLQINQEDQEFQNYQSYIQKIRQC